MYLRAPAANEPFAGRALLEWARSNNWLSYNPRGTVTPFPGAGLLPTRGVPFWPAGGTWAPSPKSWARRSRRWLASCSRY